MPLPTCNPWNANTVRHSAALAATKGNTAAAGEFQLPYVTFLAVVQDCLQRLAVKGVTGFQNLSALQPCEAGENTRWAYRELQESSLPIQANDAEIQSTILWQLANALCANQA
jgi:hypothetical protein